MGTTIIAAIAIIVMVGGPLFNIAIIPWVGTKHLRKSGRGVEPKPRETVIIRPIEKKKK